MAVEGDGVEGEFFRIVYGDALDLHAPNFQVLVWLRSGHGNESRFFKTTKEAGQFCAKVKKKHDVYFGHGLRKAGFVENRKSQKDRGKKVSVGAIPGFVMDIDIKNDKTAKNYFVDRKGVMKRLTELENTPTMVVETGGGFHAYWLFHELWRFSGTGDREAAERMALGWQRNVMKGTGYEADSTFTVDRVWRVAGSVNHKYDPASLVEIIHHDDFNRYDPDNDFGIHQIHPDLMRKQRREDSGGQVLLVDPDPKAELPEVAVNAFKTSFEFCSTFHHKRKLPSGDTSNSGFDAAIAAFGAGATWSNQEIVDTMVVHRRQFAGNLKIGTGYYERTLRFIRGDEEVREIPRDVESATFDSISAATGLPIRRIYKYGDSTRSGKVKFFVELDGEKIIELGNIDSFTKKATWTKVRRLHYPERKGSETTSKAWGNLIDSILPHVRDETDEPSQIGMNFMGKIVRYLEDQAAVDLGDKSLMEIAGTIKQRMPHYRTGAVWLTVDEVSRWGRRHHLEGFGESEVAALLKAAGFKRRAVAIMNKATRRAESTRSYYMAPKKTIDEYYERIEDGQPESDGSGGDEVGEDGASVDATRPEKGD